MIVVVAKIYRSYDLSTIELVVDDPEEFQQLLEF